MQNLIFVLVISVAIQENSGFICPVEDQEPSSLQCKEPNPSCYYPNPESCSSFIQCEIQSDGISTSEVFDCPVGLEWDDVRKQCGWLEDSTCPKGSLSSIDTTTATTTTTQPNNAITHDPTNKPTHEPTDIPTDPSTETGFPTVASTDSPNISLTVTTTDVLTEEPTIPEETTTATTTTTQPNNAITHDPTKKPTDIPTDPSTETDFPTVAPTDSPTISQTVTTTDALTEETTIPEETTTATAPETTTSNTCKDDSEDSELDLYSLCFGTSKMILVANPNSQNSYIECNGGQNRQTNSVKKCSPGLLFDSRNLICDYAGLVNPNGPQK